IGARAASKVLVQTIQVLLLALLLPLHVVAQTTAPAQTKARSFEILDNSFLVEEAFNQERGVFQNIFGFQRKDGAWDFAFTQEWPVTTERNQLSYTVPVAGVSGTTGFGDVMIH